MDKPVLFPRIFGPKKLPSNCCRIKTNIAKYNAALETQKKHTDYKWQESENWSINEDDEE